MGNDNHEILVIEDDPAISESIQDLLEINDYKVYLASNGEEGLSVLRSENPDLILCDIMMPVMDGFDFLQQIKTEKKFELTPVIMLTAKVDIESKLKGLELGADDYITKPFEFRELILRINNFVNSRSKMIQKFGPESVETTSSADAIFLNKFRLLLEENIENSQISIDYISDKLAMSNSTFNRRVKKLLGNPPVQVIKEYRLKKAQDMIRINYGTLSEIAAKTGFNSLSYFSSAYKDHFGHPPSEL